MPLILAWVGARTCHSARDSNPRPRYYEPGSLLKIAGKFNNLPRCARRDWHHEAQLSTTTDSRRSPAGVGARVLLTSRAHWMLLSPLMWCTMWIQTHIGL